MNWLDVVIACILFGSAVSGVAQGFSRVIVGIIAVVAGLLLAFWTYGLAGGFLLDYVSHKSVANFIGFLLVFGGTVVLGALAGKLMAKMFKWVGLGWLDRLLGAGLGLLRGALISMAVVLMLCSFSRKPPPESVVESRLAPYLLDASSIVSAMAPKELRAGFDESYELVKKTWGEMFEKAKKQLPRQEL
ncbi:MAG: CvpA family protein [Acidobacteriia bacterium]|nr:CvpA family protein [Terriglobia bacterium]